MLFRDIFIRSLLGLCQSRGYHKVCLLINISLVINFLNAFVKTRKQKYQSEVMKI